MEQLNLPTYSFNIKSEAKRKQIFDPVRKKFVVLTPEEWVRQNLIQYLVQDKFYPASLISVEKQFRYNQLVKRFDILVFNQQAKAVLMVECKSPKITVTQETFNQIALYNLNFQVPYLLVSNGKTHFCCRLEGKEQEYKFLQEIPAWETIRY